MYFCTYAASSEVVGGAYTAAIVGVATSMILSVSCAS